jgi:hypothetical protein
MAKATTTPKTVMPQVVISIDFGGSDTKVIAEKVPVENAKDVLGKSHSFSFAMSPEVSVVSAESLRDYTNSRIGNAPPEYSAWVGSHDTYTAVGHLAKHRFHGNPGLGELKYERAIAKTLAAVWVVQQRLALPNKFNIALSALLPYSEYADKQRFEPLLTQALRHFETPTGRCRVKLLTFQCRPEGAGIYLVHSRIRGESLLNKSIAVVMVGYRNASILSAQYGEVGKGVTCDLGFVKMVESVKDSTSGQNAERLTPAIVAAADPVNPEALAHLARSSEPSHRAADVENLVKAIKLCRGDYITALTNWIDNQLADGVSEIVFCGGTAAYLKSQLTDYYSTKGIELYWNANMVIPKRLLCDRLTPDRLSDVYGVFLFFRDKVMNEVMGWLTMQQPETSPTESSSSEPVTLHILSAS